jgi:cysteinyl-tRNA synthetase
LDFVLWQAGKPGEPAWDSPWGAGRPGWHIECSTMALELLGEQVDIHGGGADLLFPHHACEVAQAEPISGSQPWVRCWVHTAMVRKDGEKMSKSLGNLVLAHQLMETQHPDTLRLYLARNHYRSPWEWDAGTFEATAAWTRTLHAAAARDSGSGVLLDPGVYGPRFTTAMDDDLDTPSATEVVMDLADVILAAPAGANVAAAQDVLRTLAGDVLGLWLQPMDEVPEESRARSRWPEPDHCPPDGIFPL